MYTSTDLLFISWHLCVCCNYIPDAYVLWAYLALTRWPQWIGIFVIFATIFVILLLSLLELPLIAHSSSIEYVLL